jgi:thymidine kinase
MQRTEGRDALPDDFLKSLGFPTIRSTRPLPLRFHPPGEKGPRHRADGFGKDEFSARVWRDAAIAQKKSDVIRASPVRTG